MEEKIFRVEKIEAATKKTYVELFYWKQVYAFPLEKEKGFPVIYVSKLNKWLKDQGFAGKKISEISREMLDHNLQKKQKEQYIKNLPDITLNSITEITAFVDHHAATVLDWRRIEGCPITRDEKGQFTVGIKNLQAWLDNNNIKKGKLHTEPAR